jgi:hypothetical protein
MELDKNLTFSVTHGRTATTFVTQLFTLFEDTHSEHEPEPNFAPAFPVVKQDPRKATEFWKIKLDAISKIPQSNYVETSNVFGKGYFIPLLRAFDIYPNLILLTREFRAIATSLYKRGSIPARSQNGKLFSCHPEQPGTLPIFGHEQLTDYQMCYWAVLDAFRRQLQAESIYTSKGLKNFVWTTAKDLHDFDALKRCGELFGLKFENEDTSKELHAEIIQKTFNANPDRQVDPIENIDKQEAIVIDRIAYFDMLFADKVLGSKFIDPKTQELFS